MGKSAGWPDLLSETWWQELVVLGVREVQEFKCWGLVAAVDVTICQLVLLTWDVDAVWRHVLIISGVSVALLCHDLWLFLRGYRWWVSFLLDWLRCRGWWDRLSSAWLLLQALFIFCIFWAHGEVLLLLGRFRVQILLRELWRKDLKLTSLGLFECLWMNWLGLACIHFCSLWPLCSAGSYSWWDWLSHLLLFVLERGPGSCAFDLYGPSEKCSSMNLAEFGLVTASMWIDIMCFEMVIWSIRIGISISICKEGWFAKISCHRWIRQPSGCEFELLELLLKFSSLFFCQFSLFNSHIMLLELTWRHIFAFNLLHLFTFHFFHVLLELGVNADHLPNSLYLLIDISLLHLLPSIQSLRPRQVSALASRCNIIINLLIFQRAIILSIFSRKLRHLFLIDNVVINLLFDHLLILIL